jgi:hypothetical protein
MTDDQREELKLLRLASEKGTFAIGLGANMGKDQQFALERLQIREWIKLIDVTPIAAGRTLATGGVPVYRVFLLAKPALAFLKRQSN